MPDQQQIVSFISYAFVIIGTLAVTTTFFIYRRKSRANEKTRLVYRLEHEKKLLVFRSASEAEERERERISRNLHDEINLMLAVHKQMLEKHAFDFENKEFDLSSYYDEIANIEKIREAVTSCATNLVPAFLLQNGLTSTLEDYIRQINKAGKFKARFNNFLEESQYNVLNKHDGLNVYRICLELINNTLKHAFPTALTMTISAVGNELFIQIDHNGNKITDNEIGILTQKKSGLGLKSIQARSLILNATINYSDNAAGPAITLKVPFPVIEKY